MKDGYFVIETSNRDKLKSVFISLFVLICIVLAGILLMWFGNTFVYKLPFLGSMISYLSSNIGNFTIVGVFYSSFLGGIFFVPTPDEVLFYYAILKNNQIILTMVATLGGYLLAQALNYFIGWKASDYILNFVSKRKLYKSRRYINKYGSLGIFIFNFLPFPAPLVSLGLGIAKYNFKRLMIWTFLGHFLKYVLIALAYLLIGQI